MSDAEAESRESEGNQGHRIDRGQLGSGNDEGTFLRNSKHLPRENGAKFEIRILRRLRVEKVSYEKKDHWITFTSLHIISVLARLQPGETSEFWGVL
jgi:hypothetical protein